MMSSPSSFQVGMKALHHLQQRLYLLIEVLKPDD